jgi:hypothetical protein
LNYILVASSIVLFLIGFRMLRIPAEAQDAIGETRAASAVMRDPNLDDDQKEKRLQKASITLFAKLFSMLLRSAVCILISAVPLVLAIMSGLTVENEVVPLFYSWPVIVASSLAFIVVWRWQ